MTTAAPPPPGGALVPAPAAAVLVPAPRGDRRPRPRRRPVRSGPLLRSAALVGVAGLAAAAVTRPYTGDQALYRLIGRELLAGRALYTEVWDIKQPGIFLVHAAVEAVAGPVEVATRLLDVLAVLATAALVGAALRGRVPGAAAFWVPVGVAATVLFGARSLELGQVEQIALVPMTAAVALALPRDGRRPGPVALLAAGVAVGVVAVLKLWLAAVPLAAVVAALCAAGVRDRRTAARVALVVAGAALPVAATLLWLADAGALGAAWRTWFVDAVAVLDVAGSRPLGRLVTGAGRFAVLWAVLLVPAALALPGVLRRRDPLDLAALAWTAAGAVVLLGQLWWAYHWVVLVPGVAWLAARGVAPLRRRARSLVLLCALPAVGLVLTDRAGVDPASDRTVVRAELAASGLAPGESLYVLGDPLYHLESGRPVPLRLNGWSPELFTPGQWDEVGADLAGPRRPDVVLVEAAYAAVTADHGAAVAAALHAHYALVRHGADGDWFRALPAVPAVPAVPAATDPGGSS